MGTLKHTEMQLAGCNETTLAEDCFQWQFIGKLVLICIIWDKLYAHWIHTESI